MIPKKSLVCASLAMIAGLIYYLILKRKVCGDRGRLQQAPFSTVFLDIGMEDLVSVSQNSGCKNNECSQYK